MVLLFVCRSLCFVPVATQDDASGGCFKVSAVSGSASGDAMESQLRADIKFLTSEELRGRSVTDETIEVAAGYLVERMQGIGLKTDLLARAAAFLGQAWLQCWR